MGLILASASPRRRDLLQQIGQTFRVVESDYDEADIPGASAAELVLAHAAGKAREVAGRSGPADIVIGADTLVVLDGKVFGKPADAAAARAMLRELSGRWHTVLTGVAVASGKNCKAEVVSTNVKFTQLTEAMLQQYIESGEPLDKAGGYGIQGLGAVLVERIDGCYYNVVGLPLNRLAAILQEFSLSVLGTTNCKA